MVFVTLRTSKYKFNRLIGYIKKADMKDVFVQCGTTKCPNNIKYIDYLTDEEMQKSIRQADFVITHGGITVMEMLKLGKRVLCVPRKKQFKETINDYQFEMCEFLEKIKIIRKYNFRQYRSDDKKFYTNISNIIKFYIK